MACDSALGAAPIGRESVGCRVVVKWGVSPSATVGKSLAIPFDEINSYQAVRHIHGKGRLRILLRFPPDLRNLGAVGELLAVSGNARPVGLDHRGISDDRLDLFFSLTDGDNPPIFVSPELREREAVRHLRSEGDAAQDGEHCTKCGGGSGS